MWLKYREYEEVLAKCSAQIIDFGVWILEKLCSFVVWYQFCLLSVYEYFICYVEAILIDDSKHSVNNDDYYECSLVCNYNI